MQTWRLRGQSAFGSLSGLNNSGLLHKGAGDGAAHGIVAAQWPQPATAHALGAKGHPENLAAVPNLRPRDAAALRPIKPLMPDYGPASAGTGIRQSSRRPRPLPPRGNLQPTQPVQLQSLGK
mmetsp:Transcript_29331/g.66245  ORF Transcript_29331/g.66245 Transcript_29331/m.66245 type:complete len:122 (+) Transcript_29331:655-1020(+)